MKTDTPESAGHLDELLLLYVENLLDPDEKTRVETHLSQCPACASRAEALKDTIAQLKNARDAFCPEAWLIYEFVKSGKPQGTVSQHLALCDSCREEAETYKLSAQLERMPAELWAGIREGVPQQRAVTKAPETGIPSGFMERFRHLFRFPAVAAVAAAAALVVVVLYPRDFAPQGVGLSSVTWEGVLQPKAFQENAAVLVLFKNFKQPVPQARIDSIYRSLKPDMALSESFHIVSPAIVSAAIKKGQIDAENEALMFNGLLTKFNVSRVILVAIFQPAEGFNVRVDMMDTANGRTLQSASYSGVSDGRLNETISQGVRDLMLRPK